MQRADMQVCPYNTVLCRGEALLSPAEHFKTVQGQDEGPASTIFLGATLSSNRTPSPTSQMRKARLR